MEDRLDHPRAPGGRRSRREFIAAAFALAGLARPRSAAAAADAPGTAPATVAGRWLTPAPATRGRRRLRETIYITRPGTYDFRDVLHIWSGVRWHRDREYGPPALHVLVSDVEVLNFACAGAPDGVHVGGLPWNARNAVLPHPPVRNVRFHRLQVADIREDAFTCQMNTRDIVVEQSHFWGGRDKAIQNDHAVNLTIRSCAFYKGTRSIRWKAGTSGTVTGCRFLDCRYPIKADGLPWPDDPGPGRQRPGAPVHVVASRNTFVGSRIAIEADAGSRIACFANTFVDVREEVVARPGGEISGRR